MINGVNPSQIYQVQHTLNNHYQKLDSIINKQRNHFSLVSKKLEKVILNHKTLHENWRKYKNKKKIQDLKKGNEAFQKRIGSIKMRKSRFNFKQSEPVTPNKGHNYYIRKKRDLSIDMQNPQIANRILNAHGSLIVTRTKPEQSQKLAQRIEKFPMIKRLIQLSCKKMITDVNQLPNSQEEIKGLSKNYKSTKQCNSLK